MAKVLVVEDEENIRNFLIEGLAIAGHEGVDAIHGKDALTKLTEHTDVDVIITDINMPHMDGLQLIDAINTRYPGIPIVVVTAYGSVSSAVSAMKMGAVDYLQKPIKLKELRAVVKKAAQRRGDQDNGAHEDVATATPLSPPQSSRASKDSKDSKNSSNITRTLSWGAPSMKPALLALDRVAQTSASVLILGESGVGKEVFAHTLHQKSRRASQKFIPVNCAAITETLIESELFGHEKGAFTGAADKRIGVVEEANHGTVFLDEIGELKLELQSKLLRVLEQGTFQRVGSSNIIKVDVRWIAATNRNLKQMVKEGTFRKDLFHRLAAFPITLPTLAARKEDIEPLANVLLDELKHALNRPELTFTSDAIAWLKAQPWPGNIREFKNTLQRAIIMSTGSQLSADDFKFIKSIEIAGTDEMAMEQDLDMETLDLNAIERQTIYKALKQHDGNRRLAAETLGIPIRTLYNKLKRFEDDDE